MEFGNIRATPSSNQKWRHMIFHMRYMMMRDFALMLFVIEKIARDGKTYFIINDYPALRALYAELLKEIQRIKSEGDYQAGKKLIETYAVNIDSQLHKEVLERYASLNLKPYKGFINPDIVPVTDKKGNVTDYKIVYNDNYLKQMLEYGEKYSFED